MNAPTAPNEVTLASLHFAALRYLDQWFMTEAPIRRGLLSASEEDQRLAVRTAAAFFNVARNLEKRFDEGRELKRYEPVVRVINLLPSAVPRAPDRFVVAFAKKLSKMYGDKGKLSLASKLLWLRFQDPVVIFDSRAKRALKIVGDDYRRYREAWERRWEEDRAAIAEACAELPNALRYAECGERTRPEEIQRISGCTWFQRRVLDIKLWHDGNLSRVA